MIDITRALKLSGKYLSDNAPAILNGFAVVGVVSTAVFAFRAGGESRSILEHNMHLQERTFTPKEAFFMTWRTYVPAALMGTATIACVVAAHSIHTNRQAAVIGAFSLSQKAAQQFQDKALEVVGEKKIESIRGAVAEEQLKENPLKESTLVVMGNGEQLFYDGYSGRYFNSDMETIRQAENNLNQDLLRGDTISVNEFYQAINLDPIGAGDTAGWNDANLIDLGFSAKLAENGKPCGVIHFRTGPKVDFYSNRR